MKIDEKALDIAVDVYCKVSDEDGDIRNAVHEILTAYEAELWRPIEELADRKVEHVLICLTDTRNEIYDAFQADDRPVWYFADTDDPFEISHDDLVERGAMFRTIDPPTKP